MSSRDVVVRLIGLEPTRRETLDPKSSASTNFATGANLRCKGSYFLGAGQIFRRLFICLLRARVYIKRCKWGKKSIFYIIPKAKHPLDKPVLCRNLNNVRSTIINQLFAYPDHFLTQVDVRPCAFHCANSFRAYSMSVSLPFKKSAVLMPTRCVGGMPNSVSFPSRSYIGQAEKRTIHPLGSSLEKGSPAPPPVRSPTTVTWGKHSMYFTNSLAALYTPRLVRTTTRFCHLSPLEGLSIC